MKARPLAVVLAGIATTVLGANACTTAPLGSSSCGDTPDPKEVEIPRDQACNARVGTLGGRESLDCRKVGCEGQSDCTVLAQGESIKVPPGDGGTSDGGTTTDGGLGECTFPATVKVKCQTFCEGRGTDGIASVDVPTDATIAEYLVAAHRLEAISVHAFRRLHRELHAHDAPTDLLDRLRTAEREEVRHTELVANVARRYGIEPSPLSDDIIELDLGSSPRSLLDIAIENAVEGCVRETYGAVLALVRAHRAEDEDVRATMMSIALDECHHAETSMALASWLEERLDDDERAMVRSSATAAFAELVSQADASPTRAVSSVLGVATAIDRKRILEHLEAVVLHT